MHQLYEKEKIKLTKNEDNSNESSYDSLASRINFWRDINTKNN
jgi:hypothetical protein